MVVVSNQFNAAPSAAGYFYQVRLALLCCIPHLNSGIDIEVTIETIDDVAFSTEGVPIERLQAKHHVNRVGNLTDSSADLWKTIRVWAEAASKDPSLVSRAKLILITTGVIPNGSAAASLRPSSSYANQIGRDVVIASERLTDVAETSLNVALKASFSAFLALSKRMRTALLSAIEIIDAQPRLDELEGKIEDGIRLVAPRGQAKTAREQLEGWWWSQVCSSIVCNPPTGISIAAIEAKLDDIRDKLKRDAIIADMEHAEPGDLELENYNAFPFVRQLSNVGVGGNRLQYAKRDFYRAFVQRSKWMRDHVVLEDELERFEKELIEEWQPRFEAMCEKCILENLNDVQLKLSGQDLLYWVETEARFTFRNLTARFLSVGSYHMLADRRKIGWHKDFAIL